MELVKCAIPPPPPQSPPLLIRCPRTSQANAGLNMQRPEVQNNFHYSSWKSWKVKAVQIPSKRLKHIYAKQNFPVTQPCFYFYNFLFPGFTTIRTCFYLHQSPVTHKFTQTKSFLEGTVQHQTSHPHVYRCIWLKFQNLKTRKSPQFMCWARW